MTGAEPEMKARAAVGVRKLVVASMAIVAAFLVLGVLDGREYTQVLGGTLPLSGWQQLAGLFYIASYFGTIVVAPILLIAALLLTAYNRVAAILSRSEL